MEVDAFIGALSEVDTPTVANAIERLAVRDLTEGYADCRLRCLVEPSSVAMVGTAVTVTVDSTTPGRVPDRTRLAGILEAVEAAPHPTVVVFEEVGAAPLRGCHVGDVVGTMLARRGAVGLVSGSGVRDVAGLGGLGLTVLALGTVASRGVLTIIDVNRAVEVAGMRIQPGDLLHGDANGLVTVPTEQPRQLIDHIRRVQEDEAQQLRTRP